ncbi:MAG TPA: class I SAM-dependent methyltransferase [Methylomicrobium sp.]|nr:class I SAM-dependent methyltransferase [Methylomicrobium sp.]
MKFRELFETHTGRPSVKHHAYPEIYDAYLSCFKGKAPVVLEIGVGQGGSLEIWRDYFGEGSRIIGIDKDKKTWFTDDRIDIVIGDQSDREFLYTIGSSYGPFDIIIDDGSHKSSHQEVGFTDLMPFLKDPGVYMIEDINYFDGPRPALLKEHEYRYHENILVVLRGGNIVECNPKIRSGERRDGKANASPSLAAE